MRTTIIAFLILFTTSCEAPKANEHPDSTQIKSTEKVLKKVNFTDALHRYGNPQEEERIDIIKAPKHIKDAADSLTPIADNTTILHVQWEPLPQQKISVWYIFTDNQWKPLHVAI